VSYAGLRTDAIQPRLSSEQNVQNAVFSFRRRLNLGEIVATLNFFSHLREKRFLRNNQAKINNAAKCRSRLCTLLGKVRLYKYLQ
jgi:hypothetical protein